MKRRSALAALGGAAFSFPAHAASSSLKLFSRHTSRRPLLIAGSTAMADVSTALAAGFAKANPDIDVVTGLGSSLSALIALRRGSIDVAAMSRDLQESEDEKSIRSYLVARTGVDIVVNRDAGITTLTSDQSRKIMSGEIANWSEVGKAGAPIQVIAGAPTLRLIEEEVLASGSIRRGSRVFKAPEAAAEAAAGDPQAIGFILHGTKLDEDLRRVSIDGVDATRETLLSGRYPFTQSLYFAVTDDPRSTGALFTDFVRSGAGQKIIDQLQLMATP